MKRIRTVNMPTRITDEKDASICSTFPNLYCERHTTPYGLRWGLAIESGWYDLIWRASEKIENIILKFDEEDRPNYHALQIKQKFGELRFYMSATTPEIDSVIFEAEKEAMLTCEACGSKEGNLIYPPLELSEMFVGWRRRVCKKHFAQSAHTDEYWEIYDRLESELDKSKFEKYYLSILKGVDDVESDLPGLRIQPTFD